MENKYATVYISKCFLEVFCKKSCNDLAGFFIYGTIILMKSCVICNKSFEPAQRTKYCSEECAYLGHRQKTEEARQIKRQKLPTHGECLFCKKTFKLGIFKDKGRQKFCCHQCRFDYHKAIKRKNNEPKLLTLTSRSCKFCDKVFTPKRTTDKNQKFCSSECKSEYHKSVSRTNTQKQRNNTTKTCKLCKKLFSPKRSLREEYCSRKCRVALPARIYGCLSRCLDQTQTDKKDKTYEMLGFTPQELQDRLETFPQWEELRKNYWHLDHIFPICAFIENNITDIKLICRLDNLQPLPGKENCVKNDKYDKGEFANWLSKL